MAMSSKMAPVTSSAMAAVVAVRAAVAVPATKAATAKTEAVRAVASAAEASEVEASAAGAMALATITTAVTIASPAAQHVAQNGEIGGPRKRAPISRFPAMAVVSVVLLIGAISGTLVLAGRGGQELFRAEQSQSLAVRPALVLSAAQVALVVSEAPEPVPAARRTHPEWVHCRAGGAGVLRNPWTCTVRYRSGRSAHYRVVVQPNGYYTGKGTGIIDGCCVKTPTLN